MPLDEVFPLLFDRKTSCESQFELWFHLSRLHSQIDLGDESVPSLIALPYFVGKLADSRPNHAKISYDGSERHIDVLGS